MKMAIEVASKYLIDVGIQAPTLEVFNEFEDELAKVLLSYAESVKEECAKVAEKTEGSVDVEITDNRGAFLQMKRVRFIMSGAGEAIRKQVEVK